MLKKHILFFAPSISSVEGDLAWRERALRRGFKLYVYGELNLLK